MRFIQILFILFLTLAHPASAFTDSCSALLQSHRERISSHEVPTPIGARQRFAGVGDRLVYNPTGEFVVNGRGTLAARVEALRDESQSEVLFFERGRGGIFRPVPGAPVFRMQDPFISHLGDEVVFGGVETFAKSDGSGLGYRTLFYRGADIFHLKRFATGPAGMKDIRLTRMPGGLYVVATRPQGRFHPERPELDAGPGIIGMTVLESLEALSERAINDASLYTDMFPEGSWGGVNELRPLDDRYVGVLGHVARFGEMRRGNKERDRDYYAFVAIWDTQTREFSKMKIILERADLPRGFSKRRDLRNVIFSGGLGPEPGLLWVGAGDAQVYRVWLGYDPFRDDGSIDSRGDRSGSRGISVGKNLCVP